MSKNIFTASTETIATATGKMQWNTATADFRTAMQFRFDGLCKLSDRRSQCADAIKALRDLIHFTEQQVPYTQETVDGYEAQILSLQAETKAIDEEIKNAAPELTAADKNLYYAYRAFMRGEEDATTANTYERAFYEWAHSNGVVPTAETFKFISGKIGVRKMGAKAVAKSKGDKLTDALTQTAFLDVFFRVVMEILKKSNLLKSYEFQYTAPEKKSAK